MISQAEYVKVLRPLLPADAFKPNSNKLVILAINLLILDNAALIFINAVSRSSIGIYNKSMSTERRGNAL